MDTKRAENWMEEKGYHEVDHSPLMPEMNLTPKILTDFANQETKQFKEQNQNVIKKSKFLLSALKLKEPDKGYSFSVRIAINDLNRLLKDLEPTKESDEKENIKTQPR